MKSILLVMGSSPEHMDYMLTAVWSVMDRLDPSWGIRLKVLHSEIPDCAAKDFTRALGKWENLSVEFVDVLPLAQRYGLSGQAVKRLPTSYSLLGPELFPESDRMISLDNDIIVLTDLSRLWREPMGDALIGAVEDVDFNGQMRGGNGHYRRYYREKAPLSNPDHYIQAGVVLYNVSALREKFQPGELFVEAVSGDYRYDDQDVLNMRCAGRIHLLDMRWNVVHNNLGYRVPCIISLARDDLRRAYLAAREDPWIIHYAGFQKPWDDRECDFAELFWEVARKSPKREELEARCAAINGAKTRSKNNLLRRGVRWARYVIARTRLKLRRA